MVSFDNSHTQSYSFTQQIITIPFLCSGLDRYIFICVYVDRYAAVVSGITYNGIPLSQIELIDFPKNAENRFMTVYGLLNPASGTNDVVITLSTGNTNGLIGISSYNGTSGLRSSAKIALTRSGPGYTRLDVPSALCDMVVDFLAIQISGSRAPRSPQTQRWMYPPTPNNYIGSSDRIGEGGNTPMIWDMVPATAYESALIGASLIPTQFRGGGGGDILRKQKSMIKSSILRRV